MQRLTHLGWILTGMVMGFLLPAAGQEPATNRFTVTQTFDGNPFEYETRGTTRRGPANALRLVYPSPVNSPLPQNNTVPADLFLPANLKPGEARRPAVICLPILNGDEDLTSMMCSALAARGIPAIMFKLPYYGERGPAEGRRALAANPNTFVSAIEQAGADIRRTVDLLSARSEIDSNRIGIAGISLGGIMAGTAAGTEPRLYRASLLLAGGDLQTIIHHTRETWQLSEMIKKLAPAERTAVDAKLDAIDPLRHAPALRERARQGRVQMLNAGQDEVIPRACTEKLAAALGMTNQVVWFEGLGHYTALAELPRALQLMSDFFAQDLPPGVKPVAPPAATSTNAHQRLLAVIQQLVTMTTTAPATGRCHFAEGELIARDKKDRPIEGEFRITLGPGGKFMARIKSPQIGEFAAGQGRFPWIELPENNTPVVFAGTRDPVAGSNVLSYVDPQHKVKWQLVTGAAATLMFAPDLVQKYVEAEFEGNDPAGRLLVQTREGIKSAAAAAIAYQKDGLTPKEIEFEATGASGVLRFRGWQANTIGPDALFEPPEDRTRREVRQRELLNDLGALINYGGDQIKIGKPLPGAAEGTFDRLKPKEFLETYIRQ